jgi:hypothetical protein
MAMQASGLRRRSGIRRDGLHLTGLHDTAPRGGGEDSGHGIGEGAWNT